MLRFNKNNSNELTEYLFKNCIHDSKIEKIGIAPDGKSATVIIFNTWSMERLRFGFDNLSTLLLVEGLERETLSIIWHSKKITPI